MTLGCLLKPLALGEIPPNTSGAGCKASLVSLTLADPLLSASEGYVSHRLQTAESISGIHDNLGFK